MAEFQLFPRLPTELRLRIWELSLQPRIIVLRDTDNYEHDYASPTRPPAILHACHESRAVGVKLYKPAFHGIRQPMLNRHVWVNFDLDTIQVNCIRINKTFPHIKSVKHIRAVFLIKQVVQNYYYNYFIYCSRKQIRCFPQLQTFDFVVENKLMPWTGLTRDTDFGKKCSRETVRPSTSSLGFDPWTYVERTSEVNSSGT